MWGSARRPFRTAATVGGPGSEPPPYLSPSPNSSRNAPSPVPTRALSQHQLGASQQAQQGAGGRAGGRAGRGLGDRQPGAWSPDHPV